MDEDRTNSRIWSRPRIARLSTGAKMLLIFALILVPLGMIAIFASLENARNNSQQRADEMQARVEIKAQRIDSLLSRSVITIRAASAAIALSPADSEICERTLQRLAATSDHPGRYALFAGNGELRCATPGFQAMPLKAGNGRPEPAVSLNPEGTVFSFSVFDEAGKIVGAGEFARETLSALTYIADTNPDFDLQLIDGARTMWLRDRFQGGPMVETVEADAPVAGGRMQLHLALGATPLTATEFIMVIMPLLMWVLPALFGWIVVNRSLLKPLARMQTAVSAYQPGDQGFDMPRSSTPAREIGELGAAFDRVTRTVARHEAELETAVERQKKLVREVHHRVKNNLQVVASLLNLHARGAATEDVAAAYASIQRRVDALAVVHRNHYAELEENRGVALRSLISELAGNLRGTAPHSAANMTIRLDIEPVYASQDVAVSVAFLITEIVEFAMFCGAEAVTIALIRKSETSARLTVQSDSLRGDIECEETLTERFTRIVTGLSRQLRSTLEIDAQTGSYALDVAIVGEENA